DGRCLRYAPSQWGVFLRVPRERKRGRLAQQLDRFLAGVQAVVRGARHGPVRRRQHPDAVEARPNEGRRSARRARTDRMSDSILSISGLHKEYGTGVKALKSVDLD